MANYAKFDVFPMVLPEEGPRTVPDRIDFLANETQEIDLSQLTGNKWLDYVSGVYIDNLGNTGAITLTCSGSNQRVTVPADYAGYFPLLLPNPPKVLLQHTATETVTFQWYNIPVFPLLIPGASHGGGGTANSNIESIGGIPVDGSGNLPVKQVTPILASLSLALSGASETIVTAGQANNYLIIQNPVGNATVTISLSGDDASLGGITLIADSKIELSRGVGNNVTAIGTAADFLIIYAG